MSCRSTTSNVFLDATLDYVFPFEVCRDLIVTPDSVWSYMRQVLGINLCLVTSFLYYWFPVGAFFTAVDGVSFVFLFFFNVCMALFGIMPLMGVFGILTLVQIQAVFTALWGIAYMCGVVKEKPYLI